MWLEKKHADIEPLVRTHSVSERERARFLIHSHYTKIYGESIRSETPRSLRLKIQEIENRLTSGLRRFQPFIFRLYARQCAEYERISQLLLVLA